MTPRIKAGTEGLSAAFSGSCEFPVRFARGALRAASRELLAVLRRREPFARHRVLFVVDAGLAKARPAVVEAAAGYARAHRGSLELAAAPLVVPGGESAKERDELGRWLRARLLAAGLDRRSHVVIIGGGALLDAAGFVAATTAGGLRATRMPSTLAAQAAACVSLRSAIHVPGARDAKGCLAPPFGVVVDSALLEGLDERERASGLACAAAAALAGDADFFHWLCDHAVALAAGEREPLETLVRWSLRLALARASEQDALACGGQPAPGPGEWAGRAVEELCAGRLRWGECLAVGLAVDLLLSRELCGLDPHACEGALGLLRRLSLPAWDRCLELETDGRPALLESLEQSRRRAAGQLCVPLLHDIGQTLELDAVDEAAVVRAVETLKRRPRRH